MPNCNSNNRKIKMHSIKHATRQSSPKIRIIILTIFVGCTNLHNLLDRSPLSIRIFKLINKLILKKLFAKQESKADNIMTLSFPDVAGVQLLPPMLPFLAAHTK